MIGVFMHEVGQNINMNMQKPTRMGTCKNLHVLVHAKTYTYGYMQKPTRMGTCRNLHVWVHAKTYTYGYMQKPTCNIGKLDTACKYIYCYLI